MNPNLRAEKELLQLRANKFSSKTEANRTGFLKDYEFENDSKLKIQISKNLMQDFYYQNYTTEHNVINYYSPSILIFIFHLN